MTADHWRISHGAWKNEDEFLRLREKRCAVHWKHINQFEDCHHSRHHFVDICFCFAHNPEARAHFHSIPSEKRLASSMHVVFEKSKCANKWELWWAIHYENHHEKTLPGVSLAIQGRMFRQHRLSNHIKGMDIFSELPQFSGTFCSNGQCLLNQNTTIY